jgi:hypothetical protein
LHQVRNFASFSAPSSQWHWPFWDYLETLAATNWIVGGPKGAGAKLGLARTTLIAKTQKSSLRMAAVFRQTL